MNKLNTIVDAQGFREAAAAMDLATTVDFKNLAYHIEDTLSRVSTCLRALDRLIYSEDNAITRYRSDVLDLIKMAQEAVDRPDEPFDQLDRFHLEMQRAFKQRIDEGKHLRTIIAAFAVIAGPAVPLVEVERAAGLVYALASEHPEYAPQWAGFRAALEARGLVVTEAPIMEGGECYAWVQEPGAEKVARKAKRVIRKATAALEASGRAPV
ncbi:hypothetical protein C667_08163 [Thauera phenylacetica B4P]|uniref:Uncharacterized protein n=1 Tax=Thauera phenylacetica B4P TaxID=1234382 RepID=N6ZSU3_9RHOO|nr:hypothetical protein [Thauera phenylacetica]ENO97562.1 hypothetical protein C667_08163 [Thauera phenylacetica B4P]